MGLTSNHGDLARSDFLFNLTVYVTLVAVPSTEDIPNIGADVGAVVAVVAVVGVLLLIGIAIVVVVVIVLR